METKKALVIVGSVLAIGLFVFAWWRTARTVFFPESTPVVTAPTPFPPVTPLASDAVPSTEVVPESQPVAETAPVEQTKTFAGFTQDDIRKGQVTWQTATDLGDLGWTRKDIYTGIYPVDAEQNGDGDSSGGVRYVKVGTVIAGKYVGADIVVVLSWLQLGYPGGSSPRIQYFLRQSGAVTLLPNADVADGGDISDLDVDAWTGAEYPMNPLFVRAPQETVENMVRIEDIAYPNEFQGANAREVFVRDNYTEAAFFSESGLKPVFTHPDLGQVWMTDATQKRDGKIVLNQYVSPDYATSTRTGKARMIPEYYDTVVTGGFYLRRPDGTTVAYRLKPDIFDALDRDSLLHATWNDGTRNEANYEEYPGGCGMAGYVYDKTGQVDIAKELAVAGKTDQGHKDLKKYYQDTYLPSLKARQSSYDGSQQDTPAVRSAADEWKGFLGQHPIVFWVDPFGRLLEFYNADTIPLAECGKPVVYLYPEQTTDVSVRVFPSEGVSVSDPAYGDGWQVTAHPDGALDNTADGKTYPYLFWEGGSDVLYRSPEQGCVVARDGLDGFFDEKLAQLGLNARETADFKEFWIPKMNEGAKPYYFVTFLPKRQIDILAPLQIEPKPDTVIRIMMDYHGLDQGESVSGYGIRTPERRGFTAVEWGGRLQ